jgi:hypothetical protein
VRPIAKLAGSTALHYAVLADRLDVVELLVDHGADPSLRNRLGHVPLDYVDDASSGATTMRTVLAESERRHEELRKRKEKELRRKCKMSVSDAPSSDVVVISSGRRMQFRWSGSWPNMWSARSRPSMRSRRPCAARRTGGTMKIGRWSSCSSARQVRRFDGGAVWPFACRL